MQAHATRPSSYVISCTSLKMSSFIYDLLILVVLDRIILLHGLVSVFLNDIFYTASLSHCLDFFDNVN